MQRRARKLKCAGGGADIKRMSRIVPREHRENISFFSSRTAQWLDQETHDVLAFVARRLSSDPVVLVVAMRDGFNRSLGDASTLRLRLAGLGDADASRLLEACAPGLSPDLHSRFLNEARGNPLGLLELPRSERAADARDARWLPLTERLEWAFSARL